MSGSPIAPPPGWYPAEGDPPGTQRYWDGDTWQGQPRPVPGVVVADTFPLAPNPLRLVARLVDLAVWMVVFTVTLFLARLVGLGAIDAAVGYLGIAIYEIYLVGSRRATVGMSATGLRVISADGSEVGWSGAFRRASILVAMAVVSLVPLMGLVAFFAVFLLAVVGALMLYADDAQQTPWDKIGRTLVVKN